MADKSNNGGGPWGNGNNTGGSPWGSSRPSGDGLDNLMQDLQGRLRALLPAGGKGKTIIFLLLIVILLWLASGFYRIQPGEQGVQLLFGRFLSLTAPGLHYWPPSPIGEMIKVDVERTNTINIGFRESSVGGRVATTQDVPQESLMLTSDQNIIDVDFVVQWRIKDASQYLFNIRNPEDTIKIAAESVMREVIGLTRLEAALTSARAQVQDRALELLQTILDQYGSGISIVSVQLQKADPPKEVIDAFNDVQRAKQDQERATNEADAYRNDILPRARGQARKIIQDAEAYQERVINEASGEAGRFKEIYESYKNDKDATRLRLYLEKMQEILSKSNKVILDESGEGTGGVVPYLPLNELMKKK